MGIAGIETPNANLSRVMRHIDGVYTQRYNRLKVTDGPLFRGRYKAILIDSDAYLLRLSRYNHRNPFDMEHAVVSCLEDYPWSSYLAYVGKMKSSAWLEREKTYAMLGRKQRYRGYAEYVSDGVDEEVSKFYQKGNIAAILGDKDFKGWAYEELLPALTAEEKSRFIQPALSMDAVMRHVASEHDVKVTDVLNSMKGPQKENEVRKVAMYLCQELTAAKLREIKSHFNLSHVGSVSNITHQVRKKSAENKEFAARVEVLIRSIMRKVT